MNEFPNILANIKSFYQGKVRIHTLKLPCMYKAALKGALGNSSKWLPLGEEEENLGKGGRDF
jgi:hypothetical protein